MENKTTLLNKFIELQQLQFELDSKRKQLRILAKETRSLSQKIPIKLRELNLK